MSQSVAVSTIQSRVCALCDLPATLTTATNPTAAQMLDFIRESAESLGGLVKEYSGEQLLTTSGTISTVPGLSMVSLPADASDLVRLVWMRESNEEVPVELANVDQWEAEPNGLSSAGWDSMTQPRYRLIGGSTIELFPTPQDAYQLKLHYKTGIYITSTSDTILCRDGWSQWITLQTCIMVRAKQQKDGSEFYLKLYGAPNDPNGGVDGSVRRQLKRDHFGSKVVRDRRGMTEWPNDWPHRIKRYW